jgi:ornithine cyclodeaminase/alanine dehydrogenase-like protein (mu-crystallin family)
VPLYVTEAQVAELLTPKEALAAVEGALDRLARGVIVNPARLRVELPDGVFALMPCVDLELGYAGLKMFAWLPGGTPFLVVLFSLERAEVAAIVEANVLGERRTGAASAVAARLLARQSASSLGVIGCGRQAASHVEALGFERMLAWCPNRSRLERFCAEHGCEPAEDAAEAAGCDVVVTATTSRDPVLRGEWLREGALVLAIGANEPAARELDNVVLERASFVCTDSLEQARLEAGDLIEPVERGVLDWLEVHELQQVAGGELRGREHDEDVVVFKSNGLAAWDLAAAARLVELAG